VNIELSKRDFAALIVRVAQEYDDRTGKNAGVIAMVVAEHLGGCRTTDAIRAKIDEQRLINGLMRDATLMQNGVKVVEAMEAIVTEIESGRAAAFVQSQSLQNDRRGRGSPAKKPVRSLRCG
jgi:hypothetical protein